MKTTLRKAIGASLLAVWLAFLHPQSSFAAAAACLVCLVRCKTARSKNEIKKGGTRPIQLVRAFTWLWCHDGWYPTVLHRASLRIIPSQEIQDSRKQRFLFRGRRLVPSTVRLGRPTVWLARAAGAVCFTLIAAVSPFTISTEASIVWSRKADAPTSLPSDLSLAAISGKIYVFGGWDSSSAHEYDPVTDVWTQKAAMPSARGGTVALEANGNIYLAGGNPVAYGNPNLDVYNTQTDSWQGKAAMPNALWGGWGVAGGVVANKAYVVGGYNWPNHDENFTREYVFLTDGWSLKAPMPIAASWMNAAVYGNNIYVVGGQYGTGWYTYLNIIQVYDSLQDTWSVISGLPIYVVHAGVVAYNGRLYILGGKTAAPPFPKDPAASVSNPRVYSYDLNTSTFAEEGYLPSVDEGQVCIIDNKVYLIGAGSTGVETWEGAVVGVSANMDLAVQSVSFGPTSLSAGQNLSVSFRVRNVGNLTSPASNARVQLTADAVLSSSDPGLIPLDVTVPSLNPGAAYDFTGTFTVPVSISPGTYYLGVTADPDRTLNQINRANDVGLSASKLTLVGSGASSLFVNPTTRNISAASGVTSFSIRNAGGGVLSWSASSSAGWLRFVSADSGTAAPSGTVVILVYDANPSTSARACQVAISAPGASPDSAVVTFTQAGAAPPLPTVTRFEFSTIPSPQVVNTPFPVTITAMDDSVSPPQVQTAFSGRVTLRSASGGNVSKRYADLKNGTWTDSISLDTPSPQTALTASRALETEAEGSSNPFSVDSPLGPAVAVTVSVQSQDGPTVSGASVSLQRSGQPPVTRTTDAGGLAEFSTFGNESVLVAVQASGFCNYTKNVSIPGIPIKVDIELRPVGKPPVVLVPGIMGSYAWLQEAKGFRAWFGKRFLGRDIAVPILPGSSQSALSGKYAARGDLELYNSRNAVGWDTLEASLSAHYSVHKAPWDWRMPVIRQDGTYVAWREYLKPVIEEAKQCGYSKVDIVAHSMGGTLVRAYIASPDYALAQDIGKFAMVGTPNEGSAETYYLWFGGDPSRDDTYYYVSQGNYDEWEFPRKWSRTSQSDRQWFYVMRIRSLEELLPVYENSLAWDSGAWVDYSRYPGYEDNSLFQLNSGPFDQYDRTCTAAKVCAKVFYSGDQSTLKTIKLQPPCGSAPLYPHGLPSKNTDPLSYSYGDGTVLCTSAIMGGVSGPFQTEGSMSGEHGGLVGKLAGEIVKFLDYGRTFPAPPPSPRGPGPRDISPTNSLVISVQGRSQTWVLDPQFAGAGISPGTGAYSNGWPQTSIEISTYASVLQRRDAPAGFYQGATKGFPGETLSLSVEFLQTTNLAAVTNVSWIVPTNDITFGVLFNPTNSDALGLIVAGPVPTNVISLSSNGVCQLAWAGDAGGGVGGYRIYARREDESLFQTIGTTTNLSFETGYAWDQANSGTNWYFAVVAVTTNNTESPYADVVVNATPTLARFTADPTNGTPPLAVTFTNQSLGSVTNWAWDFDSDGTVDSTDPNPTATYAEPGEYSVSLSVAGPNGTDTKVAVGYITVTLPAFGDVRVLPDRTIEFEVVAQAGREYLVQSSTNLTDWSTLANFMATNSISIFRDTNAPSSDKRFYRLAVP